MANWNDYNRANRRIGLIDAADILVAQLDDHQSNSLADQHARALLRLAITRIDEKIVELGGVATGCIDRHFTSLSHSSDEIAPELRA